MFLVNLTTSFPYLLNRSIDKTEMKAKFSNVYPCRTCDSKFTTRQSKYRHEETRKVRLMSAHIVVKLRIENTIIKYIFRSAFKYK